MAQLQNLSISLRVLARLLAYPNAALRADLADMQLALQADRALTATRKLELLALIQYLGNSTALNIESEFVELFDRGHSTSLHLFEHVHGDSRDRGPAMVDLTKTFEAAGLFLAPGELPDYLPVLLEYASTQPPKEAKAFLAEMAHIFNAIFSALQQRGTRYASVLGALIELSGEKAQAVAVVADEALDASWEEPEVFGGCSVKGQSKPDQPQPIHFVKTDAATRHSAAALAGAPL
ncbi:MAG: nitrate reductase molybdenum cofactor assembly chaperone [Rhodoferax sp.]|nr:nitrate reductase molybdenum cofactor assembly chaperone [Rhodoferax sp.]NCP55508.1 nitrate reductase molybdenum cofactor assembly chaperone [Rhodoferax sp.]OIP24916.1 MAG: nitrate reductase molybdenum cofactor assembly chaperone [Comamonadaceae bacterium CG2_30_60_41]PIW06793.1 MAG: nitrate reductase molybdenum cofactor assembly chaperone [Comamonadaceae bacterium CG17_big_fil_post_rev_8_21_14_2_50_60_13]PJC11547.1 MAG: nitrate reductase molybdenum cofactor assembly chaperone [Comamonadacea